MSADVNALRARVAELRGPGVAKAQSSAKLSSKLRAAFAMRAALEALAWSKNYAAKFLGVDESVIRSWLEAEKQPTWIPLALPQVGQIAYFEALLESIPSARTGTDG